VAKIPLSLPDQLVKIIDKAKKEVLVCFGPSPVYWQKEEVISAITRAMDRQVLFVVLAGPRIVPLFNPVYQYLSFKKSPHHRVVIFSAPGEPIAFFVVADEKDFVLHADVSQRAIIVQGGSIIVRRGDRVSGNYLSDKFMEAARGSARIKL
jgi:hypothetical protein